MKVVRLYTFILALTISFCGILTAAAQILPWNTVYLPKTELRAVWLTTIKNLDWPKTRATSRNTIERQKQELRNILDKLCQANINTVIFQTRIRGSVIYPSSIEPWDECLTGKPGMNPGYDPLAFAIDECHKRGMELHAWLVAIPLGDTNRQRALGSSSIIRKRPQLCRLAKGEYFMIPSSPGTADYIASICKEIVTKYDVDGISLDYIRYPEKIYNFWDSGTNSEKRAFITRIVKAVHDTVKKIKPWVKLSSSPIGKCNNLSRYSTGGWDCFNAVYQEPQEWLRLNLQDMLFPMMYFQGNNFYPFLFDWKENSYNHPVAPGLGIYFLDRREGNWQINDIRAQIHTSRKSGIGGVAMFRSDFLTRNNQGLYDCCQQEFFSSPALTPRMIWADDTICPASPSSLTLNDNVLTWDEPMASDEPTYIYYNVYGDNIYPVDTNKGANLIRVRVTGNTYTIQGKNEFRKYYAITSCDRYGNESAPIQLQDISNLLPSTNAWNPTSRIGVNGTRVDDRMHSRKHSKRSKHRRT